MLRISDALGIGLPSLVTPPEARAVTITRAGEAAALWSSTAGGRGVLVAGTQPPDVLELWDWVLAPGDRHASKAHAPGTRELLQVLKGSVVVEVGDQQAALRIGDAIAFDGDVSHSYSNHGKSQARFSLAVFEPGVGAGRKADHV